MALRLNLGCGDDARSGYVNVDRPWRMLAVEVLADGAVEAFMEPRK